MSYALKQHEQLQLQQVNEKSEKKVPAKRVNIVSVKLVKENILLYKYRTSYVHYKV